MSFHRACCCGCDGTACTHCDGLFPDSFSLTTTGLTLSSNDGNCIAIGGDSVKYTKDAGVMQVNTTVCMWDEAIGSLCERYYTWGTTDGSNDYGQTETFAGVTDCTGAGGGITWSMRWTLTKSANKWTLIGRLYTNLIHVTSFFYGTLTVTDPVDCYDAIEIENLLTDVPSVTIDGIVFVPVYYGGTAVLTSCCL